MDDSQAAVWFQGIRRYFQPPREIGARFHGGKCFDRVRRGVGPGRWQKWWIGRDLVKQPESGGQGGRDVVRHDLDTLSQPVDPDVMLREGDQFGLQFEADNVSLRNAHGQAKTNCADAGT